MKRSSKTQRWEATGLAHAGRQAAAARRSSDLGLPAIGFEICRAGLRRCPHRDAERRFPGQAAPTNVLSWPSDDRARRAARRAAGPARFRAQPMIPKNLATSPSPRRPARARPPSRRKPMDRPCDPSSGPRGAASSGLRPRRRRGCGPDGGDRRSGYLPNSGLRTHIEALGNDSRGTMRGNTRERTDGQ